MKCNEAGLNLIKSFESCRLQAYKDVVGIWTIGYGSTHNVKPGMVISQSEADQRLANDVAIVEGGIEKLTTHPLTPNQFSALVCFAFNVGLNAYAHSTLKSLLEAGKISDAATQFERWAKAGGKVIPGLLRRRQAERDLFLS